MTDKNLALATITATGGTSSRSFGDRHADIFNVKDYGVVGDGVADDTTAIRAAILAMWSSTYGGGTLFFPPGHYKVTDEIDIANHAGGSTYTNGRIVGASRWSTYIYGAVNNGFIFAQEDSVNGPGEISHLSIVNTSTWIGSGALRLSNSSMVLNDVNFQGMICLLLPNNIYDLCVNNCIGAGNSDVTTGYNGTLGIAGAPASIKGWRTSNPFMACFQLWGSDTCNIESCGVENSVVAALLGMHIGWASSCTVSGDILTVGGNVGTLDNTPQFGRTNVLFGRGLTLPPWGSDPNDTTNAVTIVDDHSTDPALTGLGWTGTYRISASFTISTPVPMWTRASSSMTAISIRGLQTEACWHMIYLQNVATCSIAASGGSAPPMQCEDQFGVTGHSARAGLYIRSAGYTAVDGFNASSHTTLGSIYFDPSANINCFTMTSCGGAKFQDNSVTATISNGSGGAGTVLNITAFASGDSVAIGMRVVGSGVDTVITGSSFTDVTLTGTNTTGTYRVADSLNISSRAMTVYTGADWVMPTATASKTGLKFVNCGADNLPSGYVCGLNTLDMTFTCLPGQAGANTNVALFAGKSFFIVDAAKSGGGTAAPGDVVQAGGSQKIPVFYDGTNWRYGGAGQFT